MRGTHWLSLDSHWSILQTPKYDFTFFHPPAKQEQLQIDISFKIIGVNGIHTKEVDLLEFK